MNETTPLSRRELFYKSAALGVAVSIPVAASANTKPLDSKADASLRRLTPPAKGAISVAFLLSEGAQVIDYSGPWEVFQNVVNPKSGENAFQLYTVAETTQPLRVSGGMKVIPEYDFRDAPLPDVLVIPAQQGESDAMLNWIRKCAKQADLVMSVCTGAFLLAKTGLLDGKPATTFAGAYSMLAMSYPKIEVRRKVRYVESGNLASAAGLSAGIDLALHVVARYFGTDTADQTAATLEYAGKGWLDPKETSDIYARIEKHRKPPFCPVCDASVGKTVSTAYKGHTYYFCGDECKTRFLASPQKYLAVSAH